MRERDGGGRRREEGKVLETGLELNISHAFIIMSERIPMVCNLKEAIKINKKSQLLEFLKQSLQRKDEIEESLSLPLGFTVQVAK